MHWQISQEVQKWSNIQKNTLKKKLHEYHAFEQNCTYLPDKIPE